VNKKSLISFLKVDANVTASLVLPFDNACTPLSI
jgi:hypothetical protein